MGALATARFGRPKAIFIAAPRAKFFVAANKLMEAFMEATMENLGMLSLGAFAGGVLCLGLPLKPEDLNSGRDALIQKRPVARLVGRIS